MPKWNDLGNIWATIREVDVSTIRTEAEQRLMIVCVGHAAAVEQIETLLHQGYQRYPLSASSPFVGLPLEQAGTQADSIRRANLLILAIDGRTSLTPAETEGFGRLDALAVPYMVVVINGTAVSAGTALTPAALARITAIPDPSALDAADQLASAVLERLPAEFHLAAARVLPGLRGVYSRDLIATTAFSNATYALASGLPEQIPVLNVPFAAADILVLTKNQAMLVYRLALAHAAPPDFQARIAEILPVIGGAFLWRQAARSLIGLIPIWGLVPKIAIAYAGTYTTGIAAWRWYENGEMVSTEQIKRISNEALTIGRARAEELIAKARSTGTKVADQARIAGGKVADQARALSDQANTRARGAGTFFDQVRERLPFRRKP
jgi:uncharacterized protein (DUF697 family)